MEAPSTDLPKLSVRKVTLFSHGVANLELEAQVEDDATLHLSFPECHMSDVLKTLTVVDTCKGSIGSVSYKAPSQIVRDQPNLRLPQLDAFTSLLGSCRGARVVVEPLGGVRVSGKVLGLQTLPNEVVQSKGSKDCAKTQNLVLLTDDFRVSTCNISNIRDIRFVDDQVKKQLDRHMQTALNALCGKNNKSVTIVAKGSGPRSVLVNYVVESPVPKFTYRFLLKHSGDGEASSGSEQRIYVQGWAIVDNPTDEDLEDVDMTIVSGLPISFRHDLYGARYVQRPKEEIPTAYGPGYNKPSQATFGVAQAMSAPFYAAVAPGSQGIVSSPNYGMNPPKRSSLFGASEPEGSGLFGSASTQPSLFGSGSAGSLFGAQASTVPDLFGAPTSASLFGAPASTEAGLFGAPASTEAGLFGAQASTQPSLFGSASTGSLFAAPASTEPNVFGASAPRGSSLFGAPAAEGSGLFGASSFGASSFGGFGASAQSEHDLFGSGDVANPQHQTSADADEEQEEKSEEKKKWQDLATSEGQDAQSAETTDVGDLYEYNVPVKVSIGARESALVPLIMQEVEGSRVDMYSHKVRKLNTLSAVLVKNSTGAAFESGPVCLYERSLLVGEGMLKTCRPGSEQFVPYSVNLDCLAEMEGEVLDRKVISTVVIHGCFQSKRVKEYVRKYRFRNNREKEMELYVLHEMEVGARAHSAKVSIRKLGGGGETEKGIKPVSVKQGVVRFKICIPGAHKAVLRVCERKEQVLSYGIRHKCTERGIAELVSENMVDEKMARKMGEVMELEGELSRVKGKIREYKEKKSGLENAQGRYRKNLESLGGLKESDKFRDDAFIGTMLKSLGLSEMEIEELEELIKGANLERERVEKKVLEKIEEFGKEFGEEGNR